MATSTYMKQCIESGNDTTTLFQATISLDKKTLAGHMASLLSSYDLKSHVMQLELMFHSSSMLESVLVTVTRLTTVFSMLYPLVADALAMEFLCTNILLIDTVKEMNILVESCPISNEVLRYTASIMSHLLPALLVRGVKAALSNDGPALLGQGTGDPTHDFWQALQGWENLGLEGLVSLSLLFVFDFYACV